MQLGFVGLGRMGLNMVTRLVRGGHQIVAYDRSADAVARAEAAGARGVSSLEALVAGAGRAARRLGDGARRRSDRVDGRRARHAAVGRRRRSSTAATRNFHDDVRRAQALAARQIDYVDAGTSGGIWGLQEGYCLMVGGEADVCTRLEPIFLTLAPPDGYLRVGDHGAGHYVKMIHNGIEYGLMQAYAEGFELMHESPYKIDLARRRRPLEPRQRRAIVAARARGPRARRGSPTSSGLKGYVEDSGEGRWTLHEGDRPRRAAAGA